MGALALTAGDLRQFDGEARVQDARLGAVLGMAQPLNIRRVIEKNANELAMHGPIHAAREMVRLGSGSQREVTVYYLNEAQALLICMFSRAKRAPDVRAQIIAVYMAYRHGHLIPVHDADPRWTAMELRLAHIERLLEGQRIAETREFAVAVTYAPAVFRLKRDDGSLRNQRRPKFWSDIEVREALVKMHRQMTVLMAKQTLAAEFGPERAPSKSAIARFWKIQDSVRVAA